jgi:hypothetical protein
MDYILCNSYKNTFNNEWKSVAKGVTIMCFHPIMDQMLVGISFAKCYIKDIVIFSLTLGNHM